MVKTNPSYVDVSVGDQYISAAHTNTKGRGGYFYVSTVLTTEPISARFTTPDRVVVVCIRTHVGKIVDPMRRLWVSQLLSGIF